jgi:preprotein translocase subunit SecE
MSEERLEPQGTGSGSKVPEKKKEKKKHKNRIAKWFREMRSELKKVVWPTPKQIINNTLIALVVMFIASIVVWGVDQAGAQIVHAIVSLGGK